MSTPYTVNNRLNAAGWRRGTVHATEAQLVALWGPYRDTSAETDGKVRRTWTFSGADGVLLEVRDYHWNPEGTWSIGSEASGAQVGQFMAYLHSLGLDTFGGAGAFAQMPR
jgi:hypothetical protein